MFSLALGHRVSNQFITHLSLGAPPSSSLQGSHSKSMDAALAQQGSGG